MNTGTPRTDAFANETSTQYSFPSGIGFAEELEKELNLAHLQITELNQRLIERTEAQLAKNAELQREVNALRSWKEQQLTVEKDWNPQELARLLGGELGVSCHKIIQEKVPELLGQIAALRAAWEKVQGYGREDMGHQQMCDYVTETAEEVLSSPAPNVVPLEDAEALVQEVERLHKDIGFSQSDHLKAQFKRVLDTFRAKHPKKEGA